MISYIANRPALRIGTRQVIDYDTAWLDSALRRAAQAAECGDFPFVTDIRSGVEKYLETKCPLKMLDLAELFDRVRRMLEQIGCQHIAEKLRPLAPPIDFCLVSAANEAGNGFELAFFENLRAELATLREAGVEEIRFTGLEKCSLILRGAAKWNRACDKLHGEIVAFLAAWDHEAAGC